MGFSGLYAPIGPGYLFKLDRKTAASAYWGRLFSTQEVRGKVERVSRPDGFGDGLWWGTEAVKRGRL
jgi:hypothetical protein